MQVSPTRSGFPPRKKASPWGWIALFIGPYVIQKLREFQIGQFIREEGPKSHQSKAGTPTMGGVLILWSVIDATILWARPDNPLVLLCLATVLCLGFVGFLGYAIFSAVFSVSASFKF